MNEREFAWVEKFRPHTIADCILPQDLKSQFQAMVDAEKVPNLILSGEPGRGKTSVAKAMLDEIGSPYIFISPRELNLDTLRTDIEQFASSMSISGKRKYVIIDEADFLNPHIQPQLRTFMEVYSATCGFILTCNFKSKIMDPLKSRCSVIDFTFKKSEWPALAKMQLTKSFSILENEGCKYDKKVVAELVTKNFPDFRKTINELQRYAISSGNNIDSGILVSFDGTALKQLVKFMKEKDFTSIRKWVVESDFEEVEIFRKFYDHATDLLTSASIPQLVLLIAKYQYQAAFAADKQINLLAFLVEGMVELEFK